MNEQTTTSSPDHDLLIEVNTNVKNLTATVNTHIVAINDKTTDHENRLRILEAANAEVKGAQKSQARMQVIMGSVFGIVATVLAVLQFVRM